LVLAALGYPVTSAPADQKPASKTHTVLIRRFRLVPQRLEVAAGDTIVWKNEDIVPHTATANEFFDSGELDKGQSWTYVAKQKGSFRYLCTYHPTMRGELVVK
jgi:plastocyanin